MNIPTNSNFILDFWTCFTVILIFIGKIQLGQHCQMLHSSSKQSCFCRQPRRLWAALQVGLSNLDTTLQTQLLFLVTALWTPFLRDTVQTTSLKSIILSGVLQKHLWQNVLDAVGKHSCFLTCTRDVIFSTVLITSVHIAVKSWKTFLCLKHISKIQKHTLSGTKALGTRTSCCCSLHAADLVCTL